MGMKIVKELHWSRRPGTFINRNTGEEIGNPPSFTGTVLEWYETLVETLNDASVEVYNADEVELCHACNNPTGRTKQRGQHIICSADVATILSATVGFKGSDKNKTRTFVIKNGALAVGTLLLDKFTVWVDPQLDVLGKQDEVIVCNDYEVTAKVKVHNLRF